MERIASAQENAGVGKKEEAENRFLGANGGSRMVVVIISFCEIEYMIAFLFCDERGTFIFIYFPM